MQAYVWCGHDNKEDLGCGKSVHNPRKTVFLPLQRDGGTEGGCLFAASEASSPRQTYTYTVVAHHVQAAVAQVAPHASHVFKMCAVQ